MIRVDRIRDDLETLARIGASGAGIDRPSYSSIYREAVDWLSSRMRDAGMSVREDAAGNLIGRLGGARGSAVVVGSHVDSVPNGGIYDGTVGVLAGIEVARSLISSRAPLRLAYEVIAFADEEGAYLGELGCRAMVGDLAFDELVSTPGRDRRSPAEAMAEYGLDARQIGQAARPSTDFEAYVELHIEQGPVLDCDQVDIGIVTDIVGLEVCEFEFSGEANHAGTTPIPLRRDALRAAASMITRAFARLDAEYSTDRHRLTYGAMRVEPGASNVVPARVVLSQEIRACEDADIGILHAMTREVAAESADIHAVDVASRIVSRDPSARMAPHIMDLIQLHAEQLGYSAIRMPSGAGHDAQVMARVTDAGMIFIPSLGGVSHSPGEHSSNPQIERGAEVLYRTVASLLTGEQRSPLHRPADEKIDER